MQKIEKKKLRKKNNRITQDICDSTMCLQSQSQDHVSLVTPRPLRDFGTAPMVPKYSNTKEQQRTFKDFMYELVLIGEGCSRLKGCSLAL